MRRFESVDEAYRESLSFTRDNGRRVSSVVDASSIGSGFGSKRRDFKEVLGYTFVLKDPRNRLIYSAARRPSLGFNVANLIWLLSGRRDVETVSFYNKQGKAYSKDGLFYEAAFGDRIFGRFNLWQAARDLLAKDESSRRALMPIFIPADLTGLPNDTPCAASIQVMIRDKRLNLFLHMRSQSAAMVFPYDIFAFTMMHEYMSLLLGLTLGEFFYYCNSYHYYLEEEHLVETIISEPRAPAVCMDEMSLPPDNTVSDLLKIEMQIRESVAIGRQVTSQILDVLPDYWRQLFIVLYRKACIEHEVDAALPDSKYLSNNLLFT
jgi:thymidylate synthase